MPLDFLTPAEAAQQLGITRTTLYDWLGRSRRGLFELHGQFVTIEFRQTGGKGQGHIQIDAAEVERLRELMRVRPRIASPSRRAPRPQSFPGITVPLGRPV